MVKLKLEIWRSHLQIWNDFRRDARLYKTFSGVRSMDKVWNHCSKLCARTATQNQRKWPLSNAQHIFDYCRRCAQRSTLYACHSLLRGNIAYHTNGSLQKSMFHNLTLKYLTHCSIKTTAHIKWHFPVFYTSVKYQYQSSYLDNNIHNKIICNLILWPKCVTSSVRNHKQTAAQNIAWQFLQVASHTSIHPFYALSRNQNGSNHQLLTP